MLVFLSYLRCDAEVGTCIRWNIFNVLDFAFGKGWFGKFYISVRTLLNIVPSGIQFGGMEEWSDQTSNKDNLVTLCKKYING